MKSLIFRLVTGILLAVTVLGQDFSGPMTVRLLSPLSTRINKKGDPINGQVTGPSQFAGAIVQGAVKESKGSGKINGKSSLNVAFTEMNVGGQLYELSSQVTSYVNSKGVQGVDEEGRAVKHNRVAGKAAIGGIIGGIAGYAVAGPAGAAVGSAAGVASVIVMKLAVKAPHIEFNAGSQFNLDVKARKKK